MKFQLITNESTTAHSLCKKVSIALCFSHLLIFIGCAPLQLPSTSFSRQQSGDYRRHGVDTVANGSMNESTYYAVKRALAENGVVLQIVGEKAKVRVLPLPNGDSTAYVSELLTQTGVIQKLGHIEATLYRSSPDSIAGIPMEIQMTSSRDTIQPASDYALQTGDRLVVRKATNPALEMLFDGLLGN